MSEDMQAARVLRKITKHLKVALYALLGATCLVAISNVLGITQLQQLISGLHAGDEGAIEALLGDYYQHQALTALLLSAVSLVTGVLMARWVYRAHTNARALGADDMSIAPIAAAAVLFVPVVGYYFIYRTMMELARASASPMGWREAWDDDNGATVQVRAWALFFALHLGCMLWVSSMFEGAETLEALQDASLMRLGVCALAIPMVMTFKALIERICALQEVQARIPPHERMAPKREADVDLMAVASASQRKARA